MIKPDCYLHIGKIIDIVENSGFVIGNIKMAKMSLADAEEFYAEHKVYSLFNLHESHLLLRENLSIQDLPVS